MDRLEGYGDDDPRFQTWMRKVDAIVTRKCGLGCMDLADVCYRDWFDSGTTPGQAARDVLAENGLPGSED